MHKFRGSSCLSHTSQSDDVFQYYLSFVEALIYMLSSITKKGEIESATNPRVVLVINNNIYIIELIFTWESFQKSSMIWVWKCLKKWTPQNAKTSIGKSSRLHFWFSDQRSHWVHRKANTIKRGWGCVNVLVAQVLGDLTPSTISTIHYLTHTHK